MSSFRLADAYKLKSIAFPLISSGTNQFPKELALQVAMHSIVSFLTDHEMMVYLVVYDRNSYKISSELFDSIVKDEKGEIKPNILIDDTTLELEKNRAKIVGSPIKLQPGQHLSTAELMKLKTQNPDMDITPYLGKIRKE